ncbi:hypothetical protein CEK68_06170 [Xanthomonas sp. LMG 12461]|nr:hypothetical protein CEK68_06170 [Xanthomonas sp. LMG 12461]
MSLATALSVPGERCLLHRCGWCLIDRVGYWLRRTQDRCIRIQVEQPIGSAAAADVQIDGAVSVIDAREVCTIHVAPSAADVGLPHSVPIHHDEVVARGVQAGGLRPGTPLTIRDVVAVGSALVQCFDQRRGIALLQEQILDRRVFRAEIRPCRVLPCLRGVDQWIGQYVLPWLM